MVTFPGGERRIMTETVQGLRDIAVIVSATANKKGAAGAAP